MIAALLMFATAAQRSLAYEITVGLGMLSVLALFVVASLDAHEEKENDGPIREHAPEVYGGDD